MRILYIHSLMFHHRTWRLIKSAGRRHLLEGLDVPVIQLLRAHSQNPEQWRADPQGLPAMTAVYSLAQPETNGVIAPILVAGSRQDPQQPAGTGYRPFLPVSERIDTLCRRVQRWVILRRTANRDKRITFVLHNNPCKGMEATVGMAVGLDAFESLARVLRQMKKAGYDFAVERSDGPAGIAGDRQLQKLYQNLLSITEKGGAACTFIGVFKRIWTKSGAY